MANITSSVTQYMLGLMAGDFGIDYQLSTLNPEGIPTSQTTAITIQNAAPELLERSAQVRYPAVYVFCDKLTNTLKEKFSTFSGRARLVVEIRCSRDRITGLEEELERYVDATCKVLDASRGTWQDGAFYTGQYEVAYGTVRHGGRNFIQIARVTCEVEVSI